MSQRFSRTVSVIGPLCASSVKSTWGNGRNGTEQRALEGKWNKSEWRGRAHTWETLWDNIGDRNAVLAKIKNDCGDTYSVVAQESIQEITLISRDCGKAKVFFFLKQGWKKTRSCVGAWIKQRFWRPTHCQTIIMHVLTEQCLKSTRIEEYFWQLCPVSF